jgi:hypothetical protein
MGKGPLRLKKYLLLTQHRKEIYGLCRFWEISADSTAVTYIPLPLKTRGHLVKVKLSLLWELFLKFPYKPLLVYITFICFVIHFHFYVIFHDGNLGVFVKNMSKNKTKFYTIYSKNSTILGIELYHTSFNPNVKCLIGNN